MMKVVLVFITVVTVFSADACKTTEMGRDYAGKISYTEDGYKCKRWDQMDYTRRHDMKYFPEDSRSQIQNYCRNPDRSDRPWCYTTDPNVEWQYCDVPRCLDDCKSSMKGTEYKGTTRYNIYGYICQRWDKQTPQSHTHTDPDGYPDASLKDAQNYCRNPDGYSGGPWCYKNYPTFGERWVKCDVPLCSDLPSPGCKTSTKGTEYTGKISYTVDGYNCKPWSLTKFNKPEFFPDDTLADAGNYCRNPDDHSVPWCYTTQPGVDWQNCDVPTC